MNLENYHIMKIGNSYFFEDINRLKYAIDFKYDLTSNIIYTKNIFRNDWSAASYFSYPDVIDTIAQYVRIEEFRLELQKVLSE